MQGSNFRFNYSWGIRFFAWSGLAQNVLNLDLFLMDNRAQIFTILLTVSPQTEEF